MDVTRSKIVGVVIALAYLAAAIAVAGADAKGITRVGLSLVIPPVPHLVS